MNKPSPNLLTKQREAHAAAYSVGKLPKHLDLTLSEALVLGLLGQGVKKF